MRLLVVLAGGFLTGCPADPGPTFEQCELDLTLNVVEAEVGDTLTAQGRPLTDALDTAVRVDGVGAEVISVDVAEEACDTCEDCRTAAGCGVCTTCADCTESCADCVKSVSFVVPDLAAGPADVSIFNAFGASPALPLTIIESTDEDAGQ